ncbi:MAG: hypothetical protein IKC07_01185, partial [Clostridia bacterium]|nr:hypothetical protein [Clostridia bacterium]
GKSVVYYYNKSDEKLPTIDIQYIYANPEFNTTLEINPEDVVGFVGNKLIYYVGNSKKEVTITGETDVIYNGIAFPTWTEDDFKPAEGSIVLLNNDLDRDYEVAFIESYEYVISGTVDSLNNLMYCKYPTNKVIGNEDGSAMIEYYNKGRLAYFGGLGADVPLIVKESKNTEGAKIVKIETFKETVTGAIESKTADSVKIDGKVYKVSALCKYEIPGGSVRLGETVTAYIHNDKVAMVLRQETPGYTLAYLLGAGKTEEAFGGGYLSIYVREEDKTKVEYKCIEKVKVDGSVVSDPALAMDKLRVAAAQTYQTEGSDWPYSQFIRYKKNADGLVTHIDTLTYNENKEDKDSLRMFKSMEEDGEKGALSRRYFGAVRGWHDVATGEIDFILPATAKLYWVPSARDNETFFRNNHSFINRGDYVIEAYNVDPYTRKAEYAIIYYVPSVSVNVSGAPYIIKDIATSINDKEEIVYEIELTGSSKATYFCAEDMNNAEYLEVGNVVQVALNESGEVINVARKFDVTQDPTAGSTEEYASSGSTDAYYATLRLTYGTVVEFNAEHIFLASSVTTNVGGDVECEELCAYAIPSSLPIFIFNREKNIVETGSASDIISYNTNKNEATDVLAVVGGGVLKYLYVVD